MTQTSESSLMNFALLWMHTTNHSLLWNQLNRLKTLRATFSNIHLHQSTRNKEIPILTALYKIHTIRNTSTTTNRRISSQKSTSRPNHFNKLITRREDCHHWEHGPLPKSSSVSRIVKENRCQAVSTSLSDWLVFRLIKKIMVAYHHLGRRNRLKTQAGLELSLQEDPHWSLKKKRALSPRSENKFAMKKN